MLPASSRAKSQANCQCKGRPNRAAVNLRRQDDRHHDPDSFLRRADEVIEWVCSYTFKICACEVRGPLPAVMQTLSDQRREAGLGTPDSVLIQNNSAPKELWTCAMAPDASNRLRRAVLPAMIGGGTLGGSPMPGIRRREFITLLGGAARRGRLRRARNSPSGCGASAC